MTVAIYVRVSTEEQVKEGSSIGAQRERLKSYCESQGWSDYKFYVDEGKSAKDTNREYLQLMLSHIKQGMVEKVLVYRLDRMTRSVLDLHKLLETFDQHECAFISATEPYDTSTAAGRLFITIVAAIAQWERENTGERISMVMEEKAIAGEWIAPPAYGYKKVGNTLQHDEEEMPILKDMIKRVKEGYSMRQLANYLNDSGIKPLRGYQWHITSILGMLKNTALYGAMRWKGEIYENRCEPIMTKEEHDHLLKILSERQHKKKRAVNSFFVYQMKLICPTCGNHLTSERHKYERKRDNKLMQHNRYRCQVCALARRQAVSCSEKMMDKAFVNYMVDLQFNKVPEIEEDDQSQFLIRKIEGIKRQREKYQRAWANDLMTDEEFSGRMKETKTLMNNLEDELKKELGNKDPHVFKREDVMEIVNDFNENWSHLEPMEKHQFLNMFIEGIKFKKDDKHITVEEVLFY